MKSQGPVLQFKKQLSAAIIRPVIKLCKLKCTVVLTGHVSRTTVLHRVKLPSVYLIEETSFYLDKSEHFQSIDIKIVKAMRIFFIINQKNAAHVQAMTFKILKTMCSIKIFFSKLFLLDLSRQ